MHVHILGIAGTFMGGIAAIAQAAGHRVTGSDRNIYPPMSEQLAALGIGLTQGYDAAQLEPRPDIVVVGNALSRGVPVVEAMLDLGLPYVSGPQWLAEHVLHGRHVLAVAGTHGKTTTTSMLAWILESAGLAPGFLVGGLAANFPVSARLGEAPFFVIEADEYDTAFFDKRAKFVHYRPRTAVLAITLALQSSRAHSVYFINQTADRKRFFCAGVKLSNFLSNTATSSTCLDTVGLVSFLNHTATLRCQLLVALSSLSPLSSNTNPPRLPSLVVHL